MTRRPQTTAARPALRPPAAATTAAAAGALSATLLLLAAPVAALADAGDKPPLRDFMGLNGHTIQFRPTLYSPAATHVRDYHNYSWDVGDDPSNDPTFPFAENGVNWDNVYGPWIAEGYRNNVTIQFSNFTDASWTRPDGSTKFADADKYGRAFATHFGPTSGNGLAHSIQIGNEPGFLADATYQSIFRNMATGVRAADPNLPIVTSNTRVGPSGTYHKSLALFEGMTDLFDAISVNTYPQLQGYPTWERSYPEDPRLTWLDEIRDVIDWRNDHAPGKQVWITEFGYDSTTQPNHTSGTFKDWIGVTDTQQAQYLTRAYLTFSAMDVDRAYMFWFNDNDSPTVHGSSGLTRNYQPKPSYWAVSHLQATLGDYRFVEAVQENAGGIYVYSYEDVDDPSQVIWAVWSATGSGWTGEVTLSDLPGQALWADRMPLAAGAAALVPLTDLGFGQVRLAVGESPVYLRISVPEPSSAVLLIAGAASLALRPRRRRSVAPA